MAKPKLKQETRIRVRLRRIEWGDFRKSAQTLFEELPQSFRRTLKGNDAVCFISGNERQMAFVYGFVPVGKTKGNVNYESRRYGIVPHVTLRLTGSKWSPTMLANHANACGLELIGIKRFEDYYSELFEEETE